MASKSENFRKGQSMLDVQLYKRGPLASLVGHLPIFTNITVVSLSFPISSHRDQSTLYPQFHNPTMDPTPSDVAIAPDANTARDLMARDKRTFDLQVAQAVS
jgi:hypothetical protein